MDTMASSPNKDLRARHVQSCAKLLHVLKPQQRPTSASKLAAWIKRRPCSRVKVELYQGPFEMSAALLPKFDKENVIQAALVPLADACENNVGDAEPDAKRLRKEDDDDKTQAKVRWPAEHRLRRNKEFPSSPLSERCCWLKSQRFGISTIDPFDLIQMMRDCKIIEDDAAGRIVYNESTLQQFATDLSAHSKPGSNFSIEHQPIEVHLGDGHLRDLRVEALRRANVQKVAQEWSSDACKRCGLSANRLDTTRIKICKNVMSAAVRIAAPRHEASKFCQELRTVMESSLQSVYKPVEKRLRDVIVDELCNPRTVQSLQSLLPCRIMLVPSEMQMSSESSKDVGGPVVTTKIDVEPARQNDESTHVETERDDVMAAVSNGHGKGRGGTSCKGRGKSRGKSCFSNGLDHDLIVAFPLDLATTEYEHVLEILRRLCSKSATLVSCSLPAEVVISDRSDHSSYMPRRSRSREQIENVFTVDVEQRLMMESVRANIGPDLVLSMRPTVNSFLMRMEFLIHGLQCDAFKLIRRSTPLETSGAQDVAMLSDQDCDGNSADDASNSPPSNDDSMSDSCRPGYAKGCGKGNSKGKTGSGWKCKTCEAQNEEIHSVCRKCRGTKASFNGSEALAALQQAMSQMRDRIPKIIASIKSKKKQQARAARKWNRARSRSRSPWCSRQRDGSAARSRSRSPSYSRYKVESDAPMSSAAGAAPQAECAEDMHQPKQQDVQPVQQDVPMNSVEGAEGHVKDVATAMLPAQQDVPLSSVGGAMPQPDHASGTQLPRQQDVPMSNAGVVEQQIENVSATKPHAQRDELQAGIPHAQQPATTQQPMQQDDRPMLE